MPLGRERRQQRQRAGKTRPRQPAVDTFGTLRAPDGAEARVRLIEYAENRLAAFSEADPEHPLLFEVEDMHIKGRILTATAENGAELRFQKAGCGCETPYALRGGRNKLLREAGLEEPAEPAPDTLMQQILSGEVPGTGTTP